MMATPENAAPPTHRAPRWMWITLVLSLALNLLVVGAVAAAMLHFRGRHDGREARFASYLLSLPTDRRDTLKTLLDDQRNALAPLRKQTRDARRNVRLALTKEPFDRAALAAAYEASSAARAALDKARGEWITTMADTMTADERRGFLDWRMRHGPKRWGRHQREAENNSE